MIHQALTVLFICLGLLLLDFYLIRGLRTALKKWKFAQGKIFTAIYWTISILVTAGIFISVFATTGLGFRAGFLLIFFLQASSKILFLPFMIADDIRRLIKWNKQKSQRQRPKKKRLSPTLFPVQNS